MFAETSEKKSNVRVAFALVCALAVCCSVMYITADGSDEYVHEIVKGVDAGDSVGSTDVLKAGQIYTETPDGRMRLMDYFNNVEKEISDEVANRKSDIASVRAQMARDFAFNAQQRNALKKEMLKNMARNARIARANLNHAMRKTQRHFARAAHLANMRFAANQRRHRHTLALMARDKRAAARALKLATAAWHKSTNAWASATNAKIDQLNRHVSANAAQIEENAKKARKELEAVTKEWDNKVNTFKSDEKAANSRLGKQFAAQSKAQRAYASNKIKGLVAMTTANFNAVKLKMAKNRHEVDMALRQATMRFEASLNAQKALEDQRYAKTVANIAAARAEAAHKVASAKRSFKVGLLNLGSTVAHQVTKINNDIDATAAVVRSDAAAQAKVNANVNAEMSRMVKLGNKRYREHLKADAELERTIAKDNAQTNRELNRIAASFNAKLSSVRKQLARDRRHAESELRKATTRVSEKLARDLAKQKKKNRAMRTATLRAEREARRNIKEAKRKFQRKIIKLSKVVAKNDAKADKKIKKLTGIVNANALKSKQGRAEIHAIEDANVKELKTAIHRAIATGEKRAALVEQRGNKMDADTKFLVQAKLRAEIGKLRAETNKSVKDLEQENAEARKALKAEMNEAVKEAAELAKNDLNKAMKAGAKKMAEFSKKASAAHASNALARKRLKNQIKANAKAVNTMLTAANQEATAAITAQTLQMRKAIAKTNTQLDAYAKQMRANAQKARAEVAALEKSTENAIAAEAKRAAKATAAFSKADKARQAAAMKFLKASMKKAAAESDKKFGKAYKKLADDRAHADKALGASFKGLNDALAKQIALEDSRFKTTVSDIKAARKEATAAVVALRKDMATNLYATQAIVRNVEGRLVSGIAKATAEVVAAKRAQDAINSKVKAELKRVEKLSNDRFSADKRARGALRKIMDDNKKAAAAEVKALGAKLSSKLHKLEKRNAENRREMAKDLTSATETFSAELGKQVDAQNAAHNALSSATAAATAASAGALKRAQAMFDSKIVQLTNTVAANAAHAEAGIQRVTGVVNDIAKAGKKDRALIRKQTKAMEANLNSAVSRAISLGEAKAKAVAQKVAAHLKDTKDYLQSELISQAEKAADNVFAILDGKRQKIADNYLSLKAYAVAAKDDLQDYVGKGKGLALSSIGDLLQSVGGLSAVRTPPAQGLGMGGSTIPAIFSGENFKVSGSVAAINGLVNEFTQQTQQVRSRWPMGLGKYLLDKLEISMTGKGVLQVDKVQGKNGNYVYVNGRSVGLSNKLSDFSTLAAKMSAYEAVLAKLTAKIAKVKTIPHAKPMQVKPPEWQGD